MHDSIIKILPGEKYTPFQLARFLDAKCILESSSFTKGKERYSLLLVKEAFQLTQNDAGIHLRHAGQDEKFEVISKARDILDVCRYFADQHSPIEQDFPYPSGGFGYLSYEFAKLCDNIKFATQEDPLGLPLAHFIFGHIFVVYDHYTDLLYLIGFNYKEKSIDLEAEMAKLEEKIRGQWSDEPQSEPGTRLELIDDASDDDEDYRLGVGRIRDEIIAGNLLQAVLSRRQTYYSDVRPIDAYRSLRSQNPSPYLFFLDFGAYQLFGSSPEVMVKSRNGKAVLRPIAGTRARGATQVEDMARENELLSDPKERAEHLMLVDLGRNDLGRVCEPGTVRVTDYMVVERYSHVMHIVSEVEGSLKKGKTGIDAFRASFPAGTVSGAPKIRAMEILSRQERFKRGFYAGALGYIEPGGDLDTCIVIRSALKYGKRLVLQAGAGIVYDSTPARELTETKEKMAATLRAVGLGEAALEEHIADSKGGLRKRAAQKRKQFSSVDEATIRVPELHEQQKGIDSLVDEKDYADSVRHDEDFNLDAGHDFDDDKVVLDWDLEEGFSDGAKEIQDDIDSIVRKRTETDGAEPDALESFGEVT